MPITNGSINITRFIISGISENMHFSAICQRQSFRMLQRDRIQNVSEDLYRAGKDVRCLYGAHKGKKKGAAVFLLLPLFFSCAQRRTRKRKPRKNGAFCVFPLLLYYRFENCGALRAALRPYFLRSFIRGSLVRNPAFFRMGLYSSESTSRSALEMPWRMAPA